MLHRQRPAGDTGAPSLSERSSLIYLPLALPIVLGLIALAIRPSMFSDSGYGFLVLRSMLDGSAFNTVIAPDAANIANDSGYFETWWTPGQYLVPGLFVWLGFDYGVAIALTVGIATVVALVGWARVARSFSASPFVVLLFVVALATTRYATLPFRIYVGGEVLLFAVAPWCLIWLRASMEKGAAIAFMISLFSAILLFFAKQSGLVVFAATVVAIGAFGVLQKRRVTVPVISLMAGAVVAALLYWVFWATRGATQLNGSGTVDIWPSIFFPISAAALSGVAGNDLVSWLFLHPSHPLLQEPGRTSYVLGPLAVMLFAWIWYRLRSGPHRSTLFFFSIIIALSTAAIIAMELRHTGLSFEGRHLRYAGILSLLLLLLALEQWRGRVGKIVALLVVGFFGAYGLFSYANGIRELIAAPAYDPVSGISQTIVAPIALEYVRSEQATHRWRRPIAVVPSPEAAIALPGFRIIALHLDFSSLEALSQMRWAGKNDKVFVIVQERMADNGKADAVLKSFVDYRRDGWQSARVGGMIVFSQ